MGRHITIRPRALEDLRPLATNVLIYNIDSIFFSFPFGSTEARNQLFVWKHKHVCTIRNFLRSFVLIGPVDEMDLLLYFVKKSRFHLVNERKTFLRLQTA